MSRQIQIRRGTASEHDNFTGAIGEITMDTTNNTLRVHDGQTIGGTALAKESEIPSDINIADYVIATQLPSSENNWKWYRKYKSGWVEQGGFLPNKSGSGTIQLIIPLTSAPAVVSFVPVNNSGTPWASGQANPEYNYSASSGTAIAYVVNDGRQQMFWWAAGIAAS